VAALTAAGLDGCEALVLFALSEGLPAQMFQDSRGWSPDEWDRARARLDRRGLLEGGTIAPAGRELRAVIERTTDELAVRPFAVLSDDEAASAHATLATVSARVAVGGEIPFPNPMGLPPPTTVAQA
jgi:hypothetical protein